MCDPRAGGICCVRMRAGEFVDRMQHVSSAGGIAKSCWSPFSSDRLDRLRPCGGVSFPLPQG